MLVRGERACYGEAIGILCYESQEPFIPGDVANATTFDFPVRYKILKGVSCDFLCRNAKAQSDSIEKMIEGVQELEKEGVRAITMNCGYSAILQEELSNAVKVPVFTSSLMQVPLVSRMLGRKQKVGILAASKSLLTRTHLETVGIDESIPVIIAGMDEAVEFNKVFGFGEKPEELILDTEALEREVVTVARQLVKKDEAIGAMVLECSNIPPYTAAIQEAVKLPIFDYITLINWVYQAVVKKRYVGFM